MVPSPTPAPVETLLPTATFADELKSRPSRLPEYDRECRALSALIQEMANPAGDVSQKLTETALSLCHAHSAGVSVLRDQDGGTFRWKAFFGRADVPFRERPAGDLDWRTP